jgi:hypothetical protein
VRFVALALVAALATTEISYEVASARTFTGDAQDFRALSPDGRVLLAAGSRPLKPATDRALPTWLPVLAIYRTADRQLVTELTGPRDDDFYGGGFTEDGLVTATTLHSRVRWNPLSPQGEWESLSKPRPPNRPDGPTGCAAEARAGYAFSAARGIAVRLAGTGRAAEQTLEVRTYPSCEPLRQLSIGLVGQPMPQRFANAMALSPDGRWLAIGYGRRYGDTWGDSQGVVAIFSLADGHRAAIVNGRRYRRNVIVEALRGGDGGPTAGFPLGDRIAFGADGRTLYLTSERLFAVDVSTLPATP